MVTKMGGFKVGDVVRVTKASFYKYEIGYIGVIVKDSGNPANILTRYTIRVLNQNSNQTTSSCFGKKELEKLSDKEAIAWLI